VLETIQAEHDLTRAWMEYLTVGEFYKAQSTLKKVPDQLGTTRDE